MLQNKNDYAFTDDMRADLRRYLNGEESFGHYEPTLLFSNQAGSADQQADPQPDPHYFAAAGQEPPPAKKRHWWNNAEVNVMMLALAGILVILALCPGW